MSFYVIINSLHWLATEEFNVINKINVCTALLY